jgi:peroxiredoxin
VSVPEANLTGVRSITFAMVVEEGDITTDLEELSSLDKATTEKVLLNGKLFIRATMPDGK